MFSVGILNSHQVVDSLIVDFFDHHCFVIHVHFWVCLVFLLFMLTILGLLFPSCSFDLISLTLVRRVYSRSYSCFFISLSPCCRSIITVMLLVCVSLSHIFILVWLWYLFVSALLLLCCSLFVVFLFLGYSFGTALVLL